MKTQCLCLFALLISITAQGQHPTCFQTPAEQELLENLLTQAKHISQNRSGEMVYVPLTFHITNGEEPAYVIKESKTLALLCAVNEYFLPFQMQFFLRRFNYITNDSAYFSPHSAAAEAIFQEHKDFDAVNVMLVKDIPSDYSVPFSQEITLSNFVPGNDFSKDWILLKTSQAIDGEEESLVHALGHFFCLLHTFHNPFWMDILFSGGDCPSLYSPNDTLQLYPLELANGSNCEIAGDHICDTSPDYMLLTNCESVPQIDPNCDTFYTDLNNIMSFHSCETSAYFSPQQSEAILQVYNHPARAYINGFMPSTFASVNSNANLILPIDNSTVSMSSSVSFDWSDVSGATHYVLETARNTTFDIEFNSFVVSQSDTVLTDIFLPLKKYYWRVKPFNEHSFCSNTGQANAFYTPENFVGGTDPELTAWHFTPSVFGAEFQNARLVANMGQVETVSYAISNPLGQVVLQGSATFNESKREEPMTFQLPVGTYYLIVTSSKGQTTLPFQIL